MSEHFYPIDPLNQVEIDWEKELEAERYRSPQSFINREGSERDLQVFEVDKTTGALIQYIPYNHLQYKAQGSLEDFDR